MMKFTARNRFTLPALLSGIALAAVLAPASVGAARPHAGPLYLTAMQNFRTTMTRNFNPFGCNPTTSMDFTCGAIYEPLIIITTGGGGHTYPWLATGYKWTNGNKTLIVTTRQGVKWSDGQPFTAADVAFTFNYGKKYAVADQNGLWASKLLSSVKAISPNQVAFNFTKVDTTVLPYIVNSIKIIPQHIWSKVTNPGTWANPNPVGTGPFTQIVKFTGQEYILGKNPYYWQKGADNFDGVKVPLFTGNDSANLAMVNGELDTTGNFVPNIQKVYVSKDPAHFHYFYASDTTALGLFFNDQQYPYSMVGFRKALSYAIDRTKVWQIGEYGYEPPADGIGMVAQYPSWVDKSLLPEAKEITTYNPAKAKSMLASLGFKMQNGQLMDPKGHPVAIQLSVINGWTDWVLSMQIIQQDLKAIGINATVKLMDQNSWTDKADKGELSAHLHWTNGGITPYYYFYGYMSKQSYVPTGQDASLNGQTNWERWWSPEATTLLAQFRSTSDSAQQHAIINKLEKIQLDQYPFIPVMYSAIWYTYSTKHFTGWPDQKNYYTIGSINNYPDYLEAWARLKPVM